MYDCLLNRLTLQGTNMSHLGKRNIMIKSVLGGDMLVTRWKKWQERNLHLNHFRWFLLPLMATDSWNHRRHTKLACSNAELKGCNGTCWQTITSHRETTYKSLICEALIQMRTYDWKKKSEAPVQKVVVKLHHFPMWRKKAKVFETV